MLGVSSAVFAADGPPHIYLDGAKQYPVIHVTNGGDIRDLGAEGAKPVALAAGDFNEDGYGDLVAGYSLPGGKGAISLHLGNVNAFAPQDDESFQAIAHSNFPAPYLPNAYVFDVPVTPDFIAVGDFNGDGHLDLAIASKGGALYIIPGTGKGKFGAPQLVSLPGGVTTLGADEFGNTNTRLIVGAGSSLLVFGGSPEALEPLVVYNLDEPATQVALGWNLSGYGGSDAAIVIGHGVAILAGGSLQLQAISLPVWVSQVALGNFLEDRSHGTQMALLGPDGGVSIAVRSSFDPRPLTPEQFRAIRWARMHNQPVPFIPPIGPNESWGIAETIQSGAPKNTTSQPLLFPTRVSNRNADDVMILDPAAGGLVVISHPAVPQGATTFLPGETSVLPYYGTPVAALPLRVNVDGRPGVVAANQGQIAANVLMPLPDPTFTVNRTDDPTPVSPITNACNGVANDCSLREAILRANGDTVMVPAGTYTLTIAKVANDCTGNFGALSVDNNMTIIGAGQNTTIIQAGLTAYNAGTPDGVDMVMNVNEDLATASCPVTNASASISNLTLQNGHNRGTHGNDGDGGCMEFDTGTAGTANLTLTNVTLQNCDTLQGNGGGLATFNFVVNGPGLATISNSIIQGNQGVDSVGGGSSGGGIFVSDPSRILMTTSQVLNNSVPSGVGLGGGLRIFSNVSGSRQTVIHVSAILGNQANGSGGGIWASSNLLIDQGSIISSNTGGVGNIVNSTDGGGLFLNTKDPDSVTLSNVTITGNHAPHGHGGGISVGNLSGGFGTLSMQFSRIEGNTALLGSNLNNIDGTVTAVNNWWGTNTPASTINNTTTTATFDPFIVLTHTASPNKIRINQSTTLTADMSKDNHGNGAALSGNLLTIIGIPITFNNAVDGSISGAQATIQNNGMATATFSAGNVAGGGKADAVVDQATVTANIIVLQPPSITKSFSPTVIKVGGTSTITFQITNPNVVTINSSFTDDLTSGGTVSGLVVAATPSVSNGCGGSVTATAGSTSISFLNAALPVSGSPCTITVNVTGTTDGIKPNSVTIDSTDAGNGNTASASPSLTVINPPTINKVFGASTIPLNGTTSLTFTITNPNSNAASVLNGISFTDTLPNAAPGTLVVANPNGLTNTCSTTPTATAGSGTVSLTGASLAAGASCTISVNVQGTVGGLAPNSVTVSDTIAGTGNTSSTSLTVVAPPTISKSFSPKSVPLNSNSTLSFTLTNPNTGSALSGIAFTDSLPGGVKLASTTVTGSCGSGTITATINNPPGSPSTVSLSGGTLTASPAAGSSCTFSVSVTGISAGAQVNTTSTVSSTEGGTGGTASDTLTVVAPPTISKSFSPKSIPLNSNSTLSFTVTNPNTASALSGVAFTDSLPGGVKLASTTVTGSCGSGTITATINNPPGTPSTVSLSGGTLTASPAAGSSCTFSVSVTGISAGTQVNTTGTVSSTEGGTGGTASDTLTVIAPATISKSFSPKTIPLNGSSTLSFTLTNPNTVSALSGVAFTDTLPGGLKLASTTVTGSCGSGTITATINNPPGTPSTVSLSGGTLTASPDPASSCTFSVSVTGIAAGAQVNTTGTVSSTEGGTGGTASDTLTVIAPPTISKSFSPTSVPLNGNSTLSFTLTNPNTTSALSGISFTDTLPGGVQLASTTVTGSCGSGTITATVNNPPGTPSTVSLSGGTLTASPAAGSSCTFSVSVTGIAAGAQLNTTSTVSSTEGGTGGTATNTLTVVAPPSIAKAFNPNPIALNATTSLTFTITNPAANTVALTGVAFTDTLPTGLTVSNATATVCGGTVTLTAPTGISLTGATIATNSQCQFSVTVTGAVSGQYTNTTGAVSSTNGGTGNTATANLTVANPPTITKAFNPTQIALNTNSTLTFTIQNPPANVTLTGIAFTDSLPAGLVVATPNGLTGSCGGTITATAGAGTVSLSGATLATSASCTFSVNVKGTTAGVKNNSTQVTSTEGGAGNTTNASITVIGPPVIIKAFGAASVALNGTTSLTFTIQNNNTSTLHGIGFTDNLPAGLVVASPNGVVDNCLGGTGATPGASTITEPSFNLNASTSCTVTVNVTGTTAGTKNNITGNVTSTEGGTGGTASASIAVVAPPSIAKAFNPTGIPLNGTTSLTFTITNPAANTVAEAGVAFSDTLPTGLTVASSTATVCGGTLTTTAPTGIALVGASINTNSQCQFSVTVTGATAGSYTNTTGNVTSTNGGTGNTATANLSVATPPVIIKAFGAATIPLNGSTSLTFTITNPAANPGPLSGISFTDSLPAGLVVSTPNGLTGSCGTGTITATAGSGSISLSGGTLPQNANCTFLVSVTGTTAGVKNNTTGAVSSTQSGAGGTASASITVVAPPSIAKAFAPNSVPVNSNSTLTFTITNPNAAVALTGVAFTDPFPAGFVVATPNGLAGSCGGGTITATAGTTTVSLAGATLAASTNCTFSVTVTGTAAAVASNTTGNVTSTNGGQGNKGSATLTVQAPDMTITKVHVGTFKQGDTADTYTITAKNSGTVATTAAVSVVDTLPVTGLTATAISGTGWSCTLASLTCTRSDVLAAGASYPAITLTVNVAPLAPSPLVNTATVSGGGEVNTANDTATDTVNLTLVGPPLTIVPDSASSLALPAGRSGGLLFDVTSNASPALTNIIFTCSGLPAGATCSFDQEGVNTTSFQVTMTINTIGAHTSSLEPPFWGTSKVVYAGLLLPLLGLGGLGIAGRKSRKARLRLIAILGGLLLLLSFAGCGLNDFPAVTTPPGAYPVAVNAAATQTVGGTTNIVTASTTVTLTVTK